MIRPFLFFALTIATLASSVSGENVDLEQLRSRFGNHCFDCHGDGGDEGGFSFEELAQSSDAAAVRKRWDAVWSNVRAQTMPPADAEHPSAEDRKEWIRWIQKDVFRLDRGQVDPGKVVARRLNQVEYKRTIRELTGVDYNTREEFPADDTGYGFDTIGEVLTLSPVLLEKYLAAASLIVERAIPMSGPSAPQNLVWGDRWHHNAADGPTNQHVTFEQDSTFFHQTTIEHPGPYTMQLDWYVDQGWARTATAGVLDLNVIDQKGEVLHTVSGPLGHEYGHEGSLMLDLDAEVGDLRFRIDFKPTNSDPKSLVDDRPDAVYKFRVNKTILTGPKDGSRDEYSEDARRILFNGVPPRDAEGIDRHAREVIRRFADRAYRRPIDEPSLDRLCDHARHTMNLPGRRYEEGIASAIQRILISPRFLFRIEVPRAGFVGGGEPDIAPEPDNVQPASPSSLVAAPGVQPIDDYSLASRLSYFLWGAPPDDELMRLARDGQLRDSLDSQIDRMIGQDWKLRDGVSNFVGQWLQIRNVHALDFDLNQIAGGRKRARKIDFDWAVRQGMIDETETMFRHFIEQNLPIEQLLNARYTFLNESLAKHYGIGGVTGGKMRKVDLPDSSHRRGILTHGSVLLVTSNPSRTSPVKRGLFVLDNLLGTPAPPAPPNVPALEDSQKGELENASLREILEQHRQDEACASCHNRMDPLGLAMENFDAIGRYRDEEVAKWSWGADEDRPGTPIDAAGQLMTGESFSSVAELADILATQRKQDFYHCLTEKMMTFALGRGITSDDSLVLDDIMEQLRRDDGRMRTLIKAIVHSIPFTMMRTDEHRIAGR